MTLLLQKRTHLTHSGGRAEEGNIQAFQSYRNPASHRGSGTSTTGRAGTGSQMTLPQAVTLPRLERSGERRPWLQYSLPFCPPWTSEFPLSFLHFPSTISPLFPTHPHPTAAGLLEVDGAPKLIKNSCTLPLNQGHHSFVPEQWSYLALLCLT